MLDPAAGPSYCRDMGSRQAKRHSKRTPTGALATVWIVRDPSSTSTLRDILHEQDVLGLSDYIHGAEMSRRGAWVVEDHKVYTDHVAALKDATERLAARDLERDTREAMVVRDRLDRAVAVCQSSAVAVRLGESYAALEQGKVNDVREYLDRIGAPS